MRNYPCAEVIMSHTQFHWPSFALNQNTAETITFATNYFEKTLKASRDIAEFVQQICSPFTAFFCLSQDDKFDFNIDY